MGLEQERQMDRMRRLVLLIAALVALIALAGCGKDKQDVSVADSQNGNSGASPTSLAGVPPGAETQNLTIEQGKFDTDELRLQQNQSATLLVTNKDTVAYTFAVDGLIAGTALPPGQLTTVSLTTTNAGTFAATLTSAGASDPTDTFNIVVQGPGGTSP
jgi:hypothetical protein